LNQPDRRPPILPLRFVTVTSYSGRPQERISVEPRTKNIVGQGQDLHGTASPLQNRASRELRHHKPAERRGRIWRSRDVVTELLALQLQPAYQAWFDARPKNMADNGTAEDLRAMCGLDLSEPESIVLSLTTLFDGAMEKRDTIRKVSRSFLIIPPGDNYPERRRRAIIQRAHKGHSV
jgi:hypothetical protein